MSPAESAAIDAILERIDAAVGAPESETEEEHDARREMVARHAEARRIRHLND